MQIDANDLHEEEPVDEPMAVQQREEEDEEDEEDNGLDMEKVVVDSGRGDGFHS